MGVRPLGNKSSWMQCLALRVEAHAGPIVLGTKSRVPKKKTACFWAHGPGADWFQIQHGGVIQDRSLVITRESLLVPLLLY